MSVRPSQERCEFEGGPESHRMLELVHTTRGNLTPGIVRTFDRFCPITKAPVLALSTHRERLQNAAPHVGQYCGCDLHATAIDPLSANSFPAWRRCDFGTEGRGHKGEQWTRARQAGTVQILRHHPPHWIVGIGNVYEPIKPGGSIGENYGVNSRAHAASWRQLCPARKQA